MHALVGATLVDGTGAPPIERAMVLVEDGRITRVGREAGVALPAGAQVIDLGGMFLLPGMIDCHVHIGGRRSMDPRTEVFFGEGFLTARATADVRRLLEAGFTTVRDAGGSIALGLRDAINEGSIPGPRIIAAGRMVESIGGADDLSFMPLEWTRGGYGSPRLASGPAECRAAVREVLRQGSDLIKTCNNGGSFLHARAFVDKPEWSVEELRTIADEAHRKKVRLAAHAHVPESIKEAIEAGADTIEHGTLLDEECARLMVERGTVLVPTFMALQRMAEDGAALGMPDWALDQALALAPGQAASFRVALEAGVVVAMGTDCAGFPTGRHGENARELSYMVDAGMTPMQAIVAATGAAARAIGLGDTIGTIEPGKAADLIALDRDPLADVRALEHVRWVMQGGAVVVGGASSQPDRGGASAAFRETPRSRSAGGSLASMESEAALQGKIARALVDFGETIDQMELFPTLEEGAAEVFLTNPFAFLLAACLDRGTNSSIVWTIPWELERALGGLAPGRILEKTHSELASIVASLRYKPRYTNVAPRTMRDLASMVADRFGGDAAAVWRDRRAADVRNDLLRIHGVGPGLATMTLLLIERLYGVRFSDFDRRDIDVKADVHVVRVFHRTGLIREDTPEAALSAARTLSPGFPGALDAPSWVVGKRWCHPSQPDCTECVLGALCPRCPD